MFTVAGMVQFKDVFLGFEKRDYTRATTSQKCLRAGGKHNDLENVGYTARHHTFFEMLGNFSFGDYFKQDAITFAWEFLTGEQWLNLPKDKLLVTVYASDDEAYDIWHKSVACRPTRSSASATTRARRTPPTISGPWATPAPAAPAPRSSTTTARAWPAALRATRTKTATASWKSGTTCSCSSTATSPAPCIRCPPSVDTGMGLERLSTVLQHVKSNYETDALACLVRAAARETGVAYSQDVPSLKVIADHIRACCFMVADGILPSNEGRYCCAASPAAPSATATSWARKACSSTRSSPIWWPRWAKPIRNCARSKRISKTRCAPRKSSSPRRWKSAWAWWTPRWKAARPRWTATPSSSSTTPSASRWT